MTDEEPPDGDRGMSVRADLLVGVLLALLAVLVWRLVDLQHSRHTEMAQVQERQAVTEVEIEPQRGTLRDTAGKPLAISVPVESVWADPRRIQDKPGAAARLARILGEDESVILERLRSERHEVPLRRKATADQARAVRALKLDGIVFRPEYKRAYPEGVLACHVLGFADLDGIGREGLEAAFEEDLRGRPGRHVVNRDAHQDRIDLSPEVTIPPTPGRDVVLTLDSTVQFHVERALDQAMKDWAPTYACAVVIDVKTGDVLAMACRPGFDPNRYGEAAAVARKNRAVTDPLEPGSTFKIFVASGVLQAGIHSPGDTVDCESGAWTEGRRTIRDHHGYGLLSVRDVIAKSSNIGIGKLGLELGRERLHAWLQAFRFGRSSAIGLPGESAGVLYPVARWTRDSVKSVSMGYEVMVTPLQLAAAYATLGNRGVPVRPRLVREVAEPVAGRSAGTPDPPAAGRGLLNEQAWRDTLDMLGAVVEEGTGKKAKVAGYRVGGKTGTARKVVNGRFTSSKVAVLFAALAPLRDPRVALVVVLDEPRGAPFAGTAVAPVAAAILEPVLGYLQVPPDDGTAAVPGLPDGRAPAGGNAAPGGTPADPLGSRPSRPR